MVDDPIYHEIVFEEGEVALDDFLDDGPEKVVLLLEAALILGQEPVKIVKEQPVEDGALSGKIQQSMGNKWGDQAFETPPIIAKDDPDNGDGQAE